MKPQTTSGKSFLLATKELAKHPSLTDMSMTNLILISSRHSRSNLQEKTSKSEKQTQLHNFIFGTHLAKKSLSPCLQYSFEKQLAHFWCMT